MNLDLVDAPRQIGWVHSDDPFVGNTELLSGEEAGMNLWFLAGYAKGITDSHALQIGERHIVLEPDGERGWRLRCAAKEAQA